MKFWIKENWILTLLLVTAFLLRFIPLFEYEFFYDELSALTRTQYSSLSDLITKGVSPDVHPALIQLFLFFWSKIGGNQEVWMKLPFLVCSFLSCWFIFTLTRKWFGYKAALVSCLIVSCSMIFLVYSSSNHLYATAVLFAILSTSYLFDIVFGKSENSKPYILFSLFLVLGAFNHHMGALYGLIIGLLGFLFAERKQKKKLLLTAVGSLLVYAPHLPITFGQLNHSIGPDMGGWLTAPKWYACFSFIKTLFGTGLLGYLFLFLFLWGGFSTKFRFLSDKKIQLLLLTFISYCLIIYFYSILKSPILQFSVLLIASPAIIIVISVLLSAIPEKFFNPVLFLLLLSFLTQTIFIKKYFSLGIRQSTRSAITQTIEAQNKYGKKNVSAIYMTENLFARHYMNEFKETFPYLTADDSILMNPISLSRYLKARKENYLILSEPDALLLQKIKLYFPYVLHHDEGYFTNIFLLSKTAEQSIPDETIVATYTQKKTSEFVVFPTKYEMKEKKLYLDSTNEFPYCITSDYSNLHFTIGQNLVCITSYKPVNKMAHLSFDFAVKKGDSTLFYSSRNFLDSYLEEDTLQYGFSGIFIGTEIEEWKGSKLFAYFWNAGKKGYFVHDMNLKIIDCNPHKYALWD